jgi:carbonic anhydrase
MFDDARVVRGLWRVVGTLGALCLVALAACKGGGGAPSSAQTGAAAPDSADAPAEEPSTAEGDADGPAESGPPHWKYDGEHGPDHWSELDATFAACDGKEQSPIDIAAGKKEGHHKALALEYKRAVDNAILNNGHTIQVNYQNGSVLTFDGKQYQLAQFHLHAPSEHRIHGAAAAAELHLVHKSSEGDIVVVGVLLREGAGNRLLKQFWSELPESEGEHPLAHPLRVADALPKDHHYYTYAGSLTTPPCTEGVRWIVMKKPMTISKKQLARFSGLLGENARPPQPINERVVETY